MQREAFCLPLHPPKSGVPRILLTPGPPQPIKRIHSVTLEERTPRVIWFSGPLKFIIIPALTIIK